MGTNLSAIFNPKYFGRTHQKLRETDRQISRQIRVIP